MRKIIDWLEHRTGLESAVKSFLYEEIPASSGWHQVIGSMAVFSFMVQTFTGILLAFNYAPTPGDAYNSLRYIVTELTAGRVIRGWDEGVKGMRVGGRRRLTIPPAMGYGARGAGGAIGPNETLVFIVDLLAVR